MDTHSYNPESWLKDSLGRSVASSQPTSQIPSGSGFGSGDGFAGASATPAETPAIIPALTLDRVIGQTCFHNNALAINPITGDVAYPSGCVVVIYQPRRNRQSRYFRTSKAVSCLAYSRDGGMLAVGERGHQPSVTVWSLATGAVLREIVGGHRFGVGCVSFTPSGGGLVTMGFKQDRMLRVWDLQLVDDIIEDSSPALSTSPTFGDSLDPDAPPPPPPPTIKDSAAGVTAPARREHDAHQVASARVSQRVRGMDFTSDGECLVTCGNRHINFWRMPNGSCSFAAIGDAVEPGGSSCGTRAAEAAAGDGPASGESPGRGKSGEENETKPAGDALEGWPANITDELEGAIFVDITCDKGTSLIGEGLESVFSVTSQGVLCAFTRDGILARWVSLEVPTAYGLALHDGTLVVACADSLVRLFRAADLQYVATLPRPPPLGRANIASIRELQDITDSAAKAVEAAAADADAVTGATAGEIQPVVEAGSDGPVVSVPSLVLRYPAALGCRISPSGNKVVCIYADHGLFIWDVTDPLCIGKYRSFLAHGACIWDIQRMPVLVKTPTTARTPAAADGNGSPLRPDIPDGAMFTCSADGTVRVWDLGALDGKGAGSGEGHSGRWSNIYSKYLLRVLYVSQKAKYSADSPANDGRVSTSAASAAAVSSSVLDQRSTHQTPADETAAAAATPVSDSTSGRPGGAMPSLASSNSPTTNGKSQAEAAAEELTLSEGAFDPEVPHKPDWFSAPRRLAVHPGASQVACGDKQGNIRIFDLTKMELSHVQPAHEAEILSLAYSPMLVPDLAGSSPSATPPTSPPSPSGGREPAPGGISGEIPRDRHKATMPPAGARVSATLATTRAKTTTPTTMVHARAWEAIDPLDPEAAQRLMRPPEVGEGVDSTGDFEAPGSGGERGGGAKSCRHPLVMLASASRDSLVHVFDASVADGPASLGFRRGEEQAERTAAGGQAMSPEGPRSEERGEVGRRFPLVKTLENHTSTVTSVKFSNNGKRLISAGGDKMLVLNKVRGPDIHRLRAVTVPQGTIYGLDVDPTNNYIVTVGQDKRLNIWNVTSGKHVRAYRVESPSPTPLPSGPPIERGRGVAAGPGGVTGKRRGGAGEELFKVDLDPTGMYAAACSFDKWIRLFDFYSGKCLAKVSGHSELVTGVQFTPDGRRLVSIGGDGVMLVWELSPDFQKTMRDRMGELRASRGSETETTTAAIGARSDAVSATVASESLRSVGQDRPGTDGEASVVATGGGVDTIGRYHADARGVEVRAKAKAEAKARLRFQRYQLPAWAHTRESPAPEPKPQSSSAEPLEPDESEGIKGDFATAACNAGIPVDSLVAVAAHRSGVEKGEETGGNPSPSLTGNDAVGEHGDEYDDDIIDPGCRETPGDNYDVDDIPQLAALRPPQPPTPSSRARQQSGRGDVPPASTEPSPRQTSISATSKIGKGDQFGDAGAKIRDRGVGWQSGRVAVGGGRVPGGALGGMGARGESSGAGAGKAMQEGLGAQGPGGRWAKSVQEEGSLEIRGHRTEKFEQTSDSTPQAGSPESVTGSTTAASDLVLRRDEEGGVEIRGSRDDVAADSQGYSHDKNFEREGCVADRPEGAVGDGLGDDGVKSGSHPLPTDGDRKVGNVHCLPEAQTPVLLTLSPDTQVRDGSTPVLGSGDIPIALPEGCDDIPGRVNTVNEPSITLASGPAFSSASVGAGEGVSTPSTIAGRGEFVKKAAFEMGDRSTQAAAAAASPASRKDRASSRGRRIIETEVAVEEMTRRLFAMGISERETSIPSGGIGEDGGGKMSHSRVPYISPKSGDKNSRVTGASRSGLIDSSSAEAVGGGSSSGVVKTTTIAVAGKRSPVPNSAAIEAILAPESVVKELRGKERRQIAAGKGKYSPSSVRNDERSKALAGGPAVGLDCGLIDRPTPGVDNVEEKSKISHVSPEKVEGRMHLDLEGIHPSGEISLGSSECIENSVTVSYPPGSLGRASRTPSGRTGAPETAVAAVVDGPDSPADCLPSDIQIDGYKEKIGSSVVGSGGSGRDTGVLPRPDEEYKDALSRLVNAAQHAAKLYRELTEATALTAARETAVTTDPLAFPESHFDPTSDEPGGYEDVRKTNEGERSAAEQGQEYDETEGSYGDDGNENASQPKVTTNDSSVAEALLAREKSFRESFASVREVLSSIVKDAQTTRRAAEESRDSPTLASPVVAQGGTSQGGLCGSLSPSFLPPPPQSAEIAPLQEKVGSDVSGASSGFGAAFSLMSRGKGAEMRHGETGAAFHTDGRGRSLGGGAELSAEFKEMLHHYSEMMLKVVHEKMEARIAEGTLRTST